MSIQATWPASLMAPRHHHPAYSPAVSLTCSAPSIYNLTFQVNVCEEERAAQHTGVFVICKAEVSSVVFLPESLVGVTDVSLRNQSLGTEVTLTSLSSKEGTLTLCEISLASFSRWCLFINPICLFQSPKAKLGITCLLSPDKDTELPHYTD